MPVVGVGSQLRVGLGPKISEIEEKEAGKVCNAGYKDLIIQIDTIAIKQDKLLG